MKSNNFNRLKETLDDNFNSYLIKNNDDNFSDNKNSNGIINNINKKQNIADSDSDDLL